LSLGFKPLRLQLPAPAVVAPLQLPTTAPPAVCASTVTVPPSLTPVASELLTVKLTEKDSLVRARVPLLSDAVVPVMAVVLAARCGDTDAVGAEAGLSPAVLVATTVKV
jgi:hypothetical protein